MTNPNYVPERDLVYDVRYAGLTKVGQWVRVTGGWAEVTDVTFPPEHAAVVILHLDGDRPLRIHADDLVKVCG